ncbi:MAG: hypothetical protein OQJ95_00535 [Kangiella sp.]|jgi:pimeloyl-ACP methyl ester carboxylesterase|nr:hypothetical protein [Kangiella sp.]
MKSIIRAIVIILILSTTTVSAEKITIESGSGSFIIAGGKEHPDKTLEVYYHKPNSFSRDTKVLFVIPGAGRNGWSYRDAWKEASEQFNVLILSPSYSEKFYPEFWSYNLAGMIEEVVINEQRTAIDSYKVVQDKNAWIYSDFDRIFDVVVSSLSLKAKTYDMFGHSAGGQVLHRFAIFYPTNNADRILASNSGWYTVPDCSQLFPYGLKQSPVINKTLDKSFQQKLTVLLGEKDDQSETRGHLVRNDVIDEQGTYRLARGKYFFQKAKQLAQGRDYDFNWNIKIIPGVGHDYRAMSKAAARYLYE